MFQQLPFRATANLQRTALILNTVILIVALVAAELVYAEMPKEKRTHLKYFYPLIIGLGGLLVFAIYKQIKVA